MILTRRSGFALPVILVLSLAACITGLAMLQSISTTRIDNEDRRFTRLAQQAGEAGTAYASSCLEKSYHQLTWGSANGGSTLTQSTDCAGTVNGSYPSYVMSSTSTFSVRTRFNVGEPEVLNASSVQIRSVGIAEVLITGTNTVARTYTAVVKKTAVWNPDLAVQRSSSGSFRTCGLISSSVYCWGDNDVGQLGNGTNTDSLVPVAVKRQAYGASGIGSHAVVAISSGGAFNCMAIDTGEVYCWGSNSNGQLGIGTLTPSSSNVPLRVSGLPIAGDKVVALTNTINSVCALTEAGYLYCWGEGGNGQLGSSSFSDRFTPLYIGGARPTGGYGGLVNNPVVALSNSGGLHTFVCVVAANARAYCWGNNTNGQLGDGTTTNRNSPTAVSTAGVLNAKSVTAIATDGAFETNTSQPAYAHTCVIAYATSTGVNDSKPYCWGSNSVGALGNNGTTCPNSSGGSCQSTVPVAVVTSGVLNNKIIAEVATSSQSSCVTAYSSGTPDATTVHCWGGAITLGNGTTTGRSAVPINTTATQFGTSKVDQLIGGANRICARANNKAYCWGSNGQGQIGDGTTTTRYVPTEALFLRPRDNQFIF